MNVLLVSAVVSFLTWGAWRGSGERASSPALTQPSPSPAPSFDPHHPLGLNQGVGAIPAQQVRFFDFTTYDQYVRDDAQRLRQVGPRWYRIHTLEYPWFSQHDLEESGWDWHHRDLLIHTLQAQGVEILLMLGPARGNASCRNPEAWLPKEYWPQDQAGQKRFRDYVARVVERYDGDGIDDMPGLLRPVRWWQVDNEVDLHFTSCKKEGRAYATPEEYYQLTRAFGEAARAADPSARILTCAMVVPRHERGEFAYVGPLFSLHGGDLVDQIDAVDFHDYSGSPETFFDKLSLVRRALRTPKPIWVTETSVPGDPLANEAWNPTRQAGALLQWTGMALATGTIQRLFWHTLKDAPPNPQQREWRAFGTNALFSCLNPLRSPRGTQTCTGRDLKPVGAVFARLSRVLQGFENMEGRDRSTFVIHRGSRSKAAILWREGGETAVDLASLLGRGPVRVLRSGADVRTLLSSPSEEDPSRIRVGSQPVLVYRED